MGTLEKYLETSWEEQNKVELKSLEPYRHLFPKPTGVDKTINKNANVTHTVEFIPQVVKSCAWQVEKYVQQELKGLPLYEACKKLWEFVRFHVEWVRDMQYKEQVRSPRRLIWDGKGDCDCGTTFVNTCLYVYGAKNITSRITAYNGVDNFSHIYTIVPDPKGGEIIIDFCVHKFNYQKPFTKKEDHNMELQFLDGIEGNDSVRSVSYADLFRGSDLGELGRLLKKRASRGGAAPAKKPGLLKKVVQKIVPKRSPEKKAIAKEKKKATGKKILKVVNKINKINPATVLLRAGLLASMKLNIGKVAERIKWGYASPELARSKGMDMSKYEKVKGVLARTEKIFFAAGGNAANLKNAILTGRGNQNREVAGFVDGLSEDMSLSDLLGPVYADEFINGMEGFEGFGFEGFGELGEPATAASVAAAATSMGTLAALLNAIGNLFPNRGKDKPVKEKKGFFKRKQASPAEIAPEEIPEESTAPDEEAAPAEESPSAEESPATEETPEEETPAETSEENSEEANMEVTPSEDIPAEENAEPSEEGTSGILSGPFTGLAGFYQKNRGWLIPTGIVGGCLLLAGGLYYLTKPKVNAPPQQIPAPSYGIEGPPRKKRGRKKKTESQSVNPKVMTLM